MAVPITAPVWVRRLLGVDGPGDAEVGDLHDPVLGDEDVARLHVAVDDPVAVGVGQGDGHVGADLGRPVGVHGAGRAQDGGQGPAVDELHDDEVGAVVLAPVEDGDDVRVGQVGGGLGLAAEPLHEGPVDRQLGEEDLQGHGPVEQPVVGPVDLGHPPAGHQVGQLVAAGQDAWGLIVIHVRQSLRRGPERGRGKRAWGHPCGPNAASIMAFMTGPATWAPTL